jgi:NADPH:quinone reductase-like Zn-dependent oxidoreductase
MKAAINSTYGPPSIIKIIDIERPKVGPNDVLVKVHYSSVNRTDIGFLRGKPFVTRFFTGIPKPKYLTVGCEFSGVIEEVGSETKRFKPGDKVFGFDDKDFGGYAEYKIINENKMIETVPHNITLEQAAVSLEGAHYALFYIYKIPKSKKTTIFVNGATGAIGSAGVQLLKASGYYVEASSTTKALNTVKNLGADKVIDWEKQDISKVASKCDIYFDAVGKSTFKQARKILKPGGLYMSSELGPYGQNPILSIFNPLQRMFTKRNIAFPLPSTRQQEAKIIKDHLEQSTFKPLMDRSYIMKEIPQACDYVESGKKLGNVIIKIV